MKLTDIIALAKAGYSVSDVKELMNLSSSEDTPDVEENKQPEVKKEQEEGKEQPNEASEKGTVNSTDNSAIDIYEAKIKELENKVTQLQSENVHKDVSDPNAKSDEELAEDFTRSFM